MKNLLYVFILLLTFSCQTAVEKPEKPKNLISKSKMVDVLYDMALMSAAKGINKKLIENKGVKPDKYIYAKHNIDSVQFSKSNTYYSHDIKTYQDIYGKVKQRLQEDKKAFNVDLDNEKKKRDSINALKKKSDTLPRRNRPGKGKINSKAKESDLLEKVNTSL